MFRMATLTGMATCNSSSQSGSWILVVIMTIEIPARVAIISTFYEKGPRSILECNKKEKNVRKRHCGKIIITSHVTFHFQYRIEDK